MHYKLLTGSLLLFLAVGMGQRAPAQGGAAGKAESARLTPAAHEDSLFLRRLADEILVNGKAYSNLRVLTKTIGGRLSGSPQYYQAEAWGRRALEDAGADRVYMQECLVPHWVRGGKDEASWSRQGKAGSAGDPSLDVLALGNSRGTGPHG